MIFRRFWFVGSVFCLLLIAASCGDTFRPIITQLNPTPPDGRLLHYVLFLSSNGPNNPGGSSRIDVSGDTNVGTAEVGLGPVHAALLPSGAGVYVANSLEDSVTFYDPSPSTTTQSNSIPVTTISLPAGSNPVFVATTENLNA